MKKCAWILSLMLVFVLVCGSLALAQEETAEKKTEKSEKQIVIKLPEGMSEMMPGCQMMGQMGGMGQMGQSPACMMMGSAGGCGMGGMRSGGMCCGQACMGGGMMGCGMAGAGARMMCNQGPGAGCMGAGGGMMCGQMGQGMAGGMCKHGSAGCYLKCADALKLTKKQIGELKAISSAAKTAMIRKQADIKVAQAELNEIMNEDVLDFAKAKAKISEISSLRASIQTDRLSNIQKAQKVLTAEQLKQCKAMCAGMCGGGQQVKKCVTIMKAAPGAKMGEAEEESDVEESEGEN